MSRRNAAIALTAALLMSIGFGCSSATRPPRTREQLLELRRKHDEQLAESTKAFTAKLLDRVKARYDADPGKPVTVDLLVISGGGDWGAFGAGFLKGWEKVQGPLAKPEFDAVTGVSTGALISPFAFLGDEKSIDTVETLYRNPQPDWVKKRLPLYFLPNNQSFATVPGLERELKARIDDQMIKRIADESAKGRFLAVNTTDVDDGGMWVWDVGTEAERAVKTGESERVRQILLASAGIPGAFPFREIDGTIYVDGGITANILYGGRVREDQSLPAQWAAKYPGTPVPTIRFWVIFNNQIRPNPQLTEPNWPGVIARSIEMATRAATVTSIRHLFAQAEISRLKRGGVFEVRIVAVPDDWVPPVQGTFVKETMNSLADLGERMGANPSSWRTESP
jgi:predicted acylesterase/phospholipase RssA